MRDKSEQNAGGQEQKGRRKGYSSGERLQTDNGREEN
jgi:hypothetical protein